MQAQSIGVEKPLVAVALFAAAEEKFEELKLKLSSEEWREMSHSDLERRLEVEGRELLRRLYQSHLDLRGPGAVEGPVVGSDKVERTHQRIHERRLMTVFGEVEIERQGYGAIGAQSLHPLDAYLNLPNETYSLELRHRVAECAAKSSFDEVVDTLGKTTGAPVPKRQVEELTARAAEDFDAFYETRQVTPDVEASKSTGGIVLLTCDGKGVVMRNEDLRDATQKAAEQEQPTRGKRLSKSEKKNAKRMSTVAAVYTIAPFVRMPEDILKELSPVREAGIIRPRPENKRVWASLEKSPKEVIQEAMNEALHRDPCLMKTWVALVDGNETQLRILGALSRQHGLELTVIMDFIHVSEYLWKASLAFNPEGSAEAQQWVDERLVEVLRGRSSHVAAGIRRSATLRSLTDAEREPADDCADYLLKYSDYLRYDLYLAKGLPIATGVIEGACRYLVKDRMDITGAKWSLAGAEAVLKLRSLRASGDLEKYWTFHEAREQYRNHETCYINGIPPLRSTSRRNSSHLRVVK